MRRGRVSFVCDRDRYCGSLSRHPNKLGGKRKLKTLFSLKYIFLGLLAFYFRLFHLSGWYWE